MIRQKTESANLKISHVKSSNERRKKKREFLKSGERDFPGGTVVKNLPANAGDTGSIPGPGRSHMVRSN